MMVKTSKPPLSSRIRFQIKYHMVSARTNMFRKRLLEGQNTRFHSRVKVDQQLFDIKSLVTNGHQFYEGINRRVEWSFSYKKKS